MESKNNDVVLIIGGGAREHSLAWCIASCSENIEKIFCAPGNGGTDKVGVMNRANKMVSIENVKIDMSNNKNCSDLRKQEEEKEEFEELIKFCEEAKVNFVIVGPEAPICEGVVDSLRKNNIACFGPSRNAAKLEKSKAFSKEFMSRHNIPTAQYKIFRGSEDFQKAKEYIRFLWESCNTPVVVKASGLCAGKGVFVPSSAEEAEEAARKLLIDGAFGVESEEIVIEERLEGVEASIFGICNGKHAFCLPPCQDYKRVFDGDKGPNTGGMGSICPSPFVSQKIMEEIKVKIFDRTIKGMIEENNEFVGCLFAGVMITKKYGVSLLEYNVRFGDPECEALMSLVDFDFYRILKCACSIGGDKEGMLEKDAFIKECEKLVKFERNFVSVCVILSSSGYPGKFEKNLEIHIPEERIYELKDEEKTQKVDPEGSKSKRNLLIFHAGTECREVLRDNKEIQRTFYTIGGRVLAVVAVAHSFEEARNILYNKVIPSIHFDNMHYRKDIGIIFVF